MADTDFSAEIDSLPHTLASIEQVSDLDGVAPSAGYVFAAAAGFVLVLLAALATVARGRRSA
ncbi:hypothetical protein M3C51_007025 [Micrococcus luteus]|nr:hypothetical protein [Micrococcus luteus]